MGAGFSSLFPEAKQHEPDWLDQQCVKVEHALEGIPAKDKIRVLEQVIDYVRMDLAAEAGWEK